MQLYDMHSHILPGIDDGAQSVEQSLVILNELKKQGVTNVCLTPHFYTNEISAADFAQERQQAVEKLMPHIPEGMRVAVGAEVYVSRYLFNGDDFSCACLGNSHYILTEFAYTSQFTSHTMEYFVRLIENFNMIPILPHIERYPALVNNPSLIAELKDMGVVIQTNTNSYTKKAPFFSKLKLIKLIKGGFIDVLGSDSHSLSHNDPRTFTEALEFISSKCGQSAVRKMMSNAEEIFNSAL